ncbi:MAG: hypothetical protein IKH34_09810 [Oscillospiraceae bacterium]|nr:hypothetical protein [Oscillospiraceae bacterium]
MEDRLLLGGGQGQLGALRVQLLHGKQGRLLVLKRAAEGVGPYGLLGFVGKLFCGRFVKRPYGVDRRRRGAAGDQRSPLRRGWGEAYCFFISSFLHFFISSLFPFFLFRVIII